MKVQSSLTYILICDWLFLGDAKFCIQENLVLIGNTWYYFIDIMLLLFWKWILWHLFVLTLVSEKLEQSSYMDPGDHKPMQKARLTSRPQKGAPERRGHYRDQHQPEDLDPDLLMVEDHENSTQTVVISRRPSLSTHSPLHFDALHGFIQPAHDFMTECGSRLLHV